MKLCKWIFVAILIFILGLNQLLACSGYKITLGNKTILGCNEDAWRLTSRLWFENSTDKTKFGAAFTGSRFDGENGFPF